MCTKPTDKETVEAEDKILALILGAIALVLLSLSIGIYIGTYRERQFWQEECVARGFAEYYRCYKMDDRRAVIDWKWKSDQTGMRNE